MILFAAVAAVPIDKENVLSTVSVFVMMICFSTSTLLAATVAMVVVVVPNCVGPPSLASVLSPTAMSTPYVHNHDCPLCGGGQTTRRGNYCIDPRRAVPFEELTVCGRRDNDVGKTSVQTGIDRQSSKNPRRTVPFPRLPRSRVGVAVCRRVGKIKRHQATTKLLDELNVWMV